MKSLNGIAHSIKAATGYSDRTAAADRRRCGKIYNILFPVSCLNSGLCLWCCYNI